MRLLRVQKPFDHPEWIFEPKMDGFRALAHVQGHRCTLVIPPWARAQILAPARGGDRAQRAGAECDP